MGTADVSAAAGPAEEATDVVLVDPGALVVVEQLAPAGAAALARVPGTALDPFDRLVVAFLTGRKQAHTKTAYAADLTAWRTWCLTTAPDEYRVHPLLATRPHVDAWVDHLGRTPSARTGRPLSPASVARRLSGLSKFYAYALSLGVLERSPLDQVERPAVSDESSTAGLTASELVALLDAADAHSPRAAALISVLVFTGCRISEALGADLTDYRHDRGHRVLRIRRKGGKRASVALPPATVRALDDLIGERTHGSIFLSRTGEPLAYKTAYDLIKRLAKTAGIPSADLIKPHSLRHGFATEALAIGIPLQDVQDALGHRDPRTTRRYDRTRHNLDRSPAYSLAQALRRP
jgi:integrase/recombinase XerD